MKINTYIHELLLDHETVIIPGFGAFISNYKPAQILAEKDKIIPPSKELIFNPKIRNNDGILVGFVAEKEGISHFDALKKIEKERENFLYKLDKGEKITFNNIGVLFRDDNKDIAFESFKEENFLLDSFGLEATSLTETKPKTVEENKEEKEVLVSDRSAENMEPEKPQSPEPDKNDEPLQDKAKTEEELFWESINENANHAEEKKEKKKRSWLWALLILIPIIVAGIFLLKKGNQNFPPSSDNIKEEPKSETQITNSQNFSTVDSMKTDTTKKETLGATRNDTIANKEKDILTNQGNFYLVGGSFKEEENAVKFMEEFNLEEYEPSLLGKRGNFYIVTIGRFNTEAEAVSAKNDFLKKNPESGTWIYEEETK